MSPISRFWRSVSFFALLLCHIAPVSAADQAVILQYHHVSTSTPAVTSISPEDFRKHMDYLEETDFNILPLPEVLSALQAGTPLPERAAVITFDDGYESVYTAAFPVLQEKGWPFTIFVTSGLVGSNPGLYTSWDHLREMGDQGATLANHTVNHPHLIDIAPGQNEEDWLAGVEQEITQAESRIEQETGQSHKLLAYPYGEYDPRIEELVESLGFVGIGQQSGPVNGSSNFTALPRFPFSGVYVAMNTFAIKANSLAFGVEETRPASPVTTEPSPGAYLRVSENPGNLNCFNNDEPISVELSEGGFNISTHIENRSRRFRYNCTAAGPDGRYYWYSIHFVNPTVPE